jgi:CDP-paratose 2-epimerase
VEHGHTYYDGIREDMSIDHTLHSLFGASKVAADVLVQEYGRYFGLRTACFRGGTLTGPHHSAAELHGFLAYVMRCLMSRKRYKVFGYKGKQVRDAIHSHDLISAFDAFFRAPRVAEVYNIGGGRFSNASVLEAIELSEEIAGERLDWTYEEANRIGDHIWWIGDNGRFQSHYPDWKLEYDVRRILEEMHEANAARWRPG